MGLLLEHCKEIKLLTPLIEERGSHVAFYHQQGYEISRALADNGVIADYRAPGVIRFGIAPLYNNLNDVELAAKKLADIIKNNHYHKPLYKQQLKVT
jgi:kynureninase